VVRGGQARIDNFYGRSVLFVADAERSVAFYRDTLGFALDWSHHDDGRLTVVQVNLRGFDLILNETDSKTRNRAGRGRVFVGLDDEQSDAFLAHVKEKGIPTTVIQWGEPTIVIRDVDGNELFFWLSETRRRTLKP
jgi:catechol 2,3-dioxygenase-like lactoylglutathione lyase family enzyme